MTDALRQYIETALWSTNDDSTPSGGVPLDDNYSADDLAPETLARMTADWEAFCKRAGELGLMSVPFRSLTDIAHDFWLTRNGHGCGFWDGDYVEPYASRLTALAKTFGEQWIYVGDDSRLYIGGGKVPQ